MLFYQEANLFLRAGDDMRFTEWPKEDFIRMVEGTPLPIEGYEIKPYIPTQNELLTQKWRRA